LINVLLLTFTGAFFLVPLEILDNLGKIMRLPGLIFGGTKGVDKVNDFFTWLKHLLTNMNGY